ncbi:ExbD/TolR family protein [Thiomicrorhabdus lithotrophica]|uniref:Biopolymer transporter ExbD n=1 Tax=Thiomicrorhabdus lithotrophica TaxID=2949997 RepID=A0ABY8CBC6_9GAMM|nr:biopolymer transporter ExbD [Thiomicrorhabdus lithotrophica]WEJ63276.1 biopolymer transporter ExbD [Thiomicrorhabdus lithotrophica]
MIRQAPKRFDSMNVIPLIDVMLVLLAIVLMTASFIVKDSLNIDLPETVNTQSYAPEKDEKPIHLYINNSNEYFVDEAPQNLDSIKQLLTTLNTKQAVTLQVDKKADFGTFVSLIDALKGQNLTNLTILTKSEQAAK